MLLNLYRLFVSYEPHLEQLNCPRFEYSHQGVDFASCRVVRSNSLHKHFEIAFIIDLSLFFVVRIVSDV